MGLLGYMVSSMFGQGEAYMVNQMTGRGGVGTTLGDMFWGSMSGISAADTAWAGGRMQASLMHMMGMSPRMVGMMTNPTMAMVAQNPILASMMGMHPFSMPQMPYSSPCYGGWS
jgi:hypothetical protein